MQDSAAAVPDASPADAAVSPRRKVALVAVLALGLTACLIADIAGALRPRKGAGWGLLLRQWAPFAVAAILCAIPIVRNAVANLLQRISNPAPRTRRRITIAIALLATGYLFFTARWQGRDLYAKEQDESMYLTQAQMLARGKLWMPQHPCAEFFESYHVVVRPVYAGMYFPGNALAYVPAIWLKLPFYAISLLIAGLSVGMTYRVLAEMIDGAAGALGSLLMLASLMFRHISTMVMSHTLMLLLALVLTWAYLRWRKNHGLGWAALLGLLAGWAAITRPLDALCYLVPLALVILWDLRTLPWRRRIASVVVAGFAMLPTLSLQVVLNYGVTGRLGQTPVTMYHHHYWPHVAIGFKGGLEAYKPPTAIGQFEQYYQRYIVPSFTQFRTTDPLTLTAGVRLPLLMNVALPSILLASLIPLAFFEMRRREHGAFFAAFPAFLAGYATFMFFRKHYGVVVFPAIFLGVLLGARAVGCAFPRWQKGWSAFFAMTIIALVVASLPEFNQKIRDQIWPTPILSAANRAARRIENKPALLFIRHTPGDDSWSQEPVYNIDTDYPDHAPVIRAHDLGERNIELIRYYARLQPNRSVYLFDKATLKTTRRGTVAELANETGSRGVILHP